MIYTYDLIIGEQRIVTGFRLQAWRKTLQFGKITLENNGTYECQAANRYSGAVDSVRFTLLVNGNADKPDEQISYFYFYVVGGVGIFTTILIIVVLFIYFYKKKNKFH